MRIFLFTFLLFVIPAMQVCAQLHTVKGKVTTTSIEPMPFVSVFVENQVNHTATNDKGEYRMKLENGKYNLVFSFLGYKSLKKEIVINGADIVVNAILEEDQQVLNEVVISSKYTDPARGVIQNVIKNKERYLKNAYTTDLYIKAVESNSASRHARDSIDNLNFTRDSLRFVEKGKKDGDTLAPKRKNTFNEQLNFAEILIRKSFEYPDKIKEQRVGYRKYGTTENLFYLRGTEGEFNFYSNAVRCPSLSEMPFLSPISVTGLMMYKFKTVKTFYENGHYIYRIKVEPTVIANSVISGELEVIDTLFCIRSFTFAFPRNQLPEFTQFELRADFEPYNDTIYKPSRYEFRYKHGGKKDPMQGKTVVYFDNFKYQKEFSKRYFGNEVSSTLEEAYKKDSTFWQQVRKEPLNESEIKYIRVQDSIKTAHESKQYLDSMDRITNKVTAYKILLAGVTKFDREKNLYMYFNPVVTMYQPVGVGGARLRYGAGVTKVTKDKKFFNNYGDISYGIKNGDVIGSFYSGYLYNTFKRAFVNLYLAKEYDIINNNSTYLSRFRTSNFYLNRHISLSHSFELVNGLFLYNSVDYATRRSISGIKNDTLTSLLFSNYKYTPADFTGYDAFFTENTLSYTPFQKYIREPRQKLILGSKFPTASVTYRKGVPGVFNSSIDYDYLEFSVFQNIDFGFLGIAKYTLNTGKFYNFTSVKQVDYKYQSQVGFPFFADPLNAFQSLDKSYITIDRFYSGHYFHRFNGALINKIPYAKVLGLVESAGGGFLFSKENNLSYYEVFVGLEKKFMFFNETYRFGVFWVNAQSNTASFQSGIRFSLDHYDRYSNKWSY